MIKARFRAEPGRLRREPVVPQGLAGLVDGAALVHIWSAPRCKSEIAVEQKKEKLRPYIRHLDEVADSASCP
ncbi:hypothetical protein, partial [Thiohalocapsa marina]|uniref:hypothetical protein n=1 Tax=Thiohalocapsa marina TaxID=424902 RepID=UPI0036DE6944